VRLDRVLIQLAKYTQELPEARDDPGKEPAAPHVPHQTVNAVVGHREYAHDPLHQSRQARTAFKPQHDMDMVPHNADVLDPEGIFRLRTPHYLQE